MTEFYNYNSDSDEELSMDTYEEIDINMSNPAFDKIVARVSETFPYSCICFITEIKNSKLLNAFNDKKEEIEKRLIDEGSDIQVKVEQLFHGTTKLAVKSISETGFLTKFNRTSAFGMGTYFAQAAKYSFNYMKDQTNGLSYMFLADVLVGRKEVGSSRKVAPSNVDNLVDRVHNTTIYVTPYDAGAYPRYIVAFHKNAQ